MTAAPMAKMAVTFAVNRSSAPRASSVAPASRVKPTTVRGGTSEIAMATPGNVSEMSERQRATAPTAPVANAAIRSMRRGLTRLATCALSAASTGVGTKSPIR